MSIIRRFFRLAFVLLFIFSIIPVPLLQATPVLAAPGWGKFPGQLTLGGQKYVIDSTVIKDGNTYKMWYTYIKMSSSIEQLLGQVKGLHLDTLVTDLQNYQLSAFLNDLAALNPDMPALRTIFSGMAGAIGYATSTDGKTWAVQNANALQGTSGGLWTSVGFPTIVNDGGNYKMWFTRLETTLTQPNIQTIFTNMQVPAQRRAALDALLSSTRTVIGYATSPDSGATWNVVNPTALVTPVGAWSVLNSVAAPSVILDAGTYKMWYTRLKTTFTGTDLDNLLAKVLAGNVQITDLMNILSGTSFVIGYAESGDGITFAVQNNQVLTGGSGFAGSVLNPCVLKTGSTYEMWYSDLVSNLNAGGLLNVFGAIKGIGIPALWNSLKTKTFGDFIMDLVNINANTVRTTLTGTSGGIGYATSPDGTGWNITNPNELVGTSVTPWSSVGAPSVVKSASLTEMWFSQGIPALDWQNVFDRVIGTNLGLGYASSKVLVSIAVTPQAASVPKGRTQPYTAIGTFNDATTENLTAAPGIVWTSSDVTKATISGGGLATGAGIGSTLISASYGLVTSNMASLTVTSPVLQTLTVIPGNPFVPKGKPQQFTATGTYSDSSTADLSTVVSWSSSNLGVATIGTTGLANTLTVGATTITASLSGVPGTTTLNVIAPVFDRLVITPDNASVALGASIQFAVTEYLTDGTFTDGTATAVWASDSAAVTVATAPAANPGKVIGVSTPGSANITANYNTHVATTAVTVGPAGLVSIAITAPATTVPAGTAMALPFTITGTYTDLTTAPIVGGITWASLNPAVATITTGGLVSGVTIGTATIRATVSGFTRTVVVTVTQPELVSITVLPANTTAIVGSPAFTYSAVGNYSDGSSAPLTSGVTWSYTSAPATNVITINAGTGQVILVGAGTATITASHATIYPTIPPNTPVTGNTGLTVLAVTVNSVTVTAAPNLSIPKGRTRQFTATANYTGGSADVTGVATWSSASTGVATISAGGVVTAVNLGTSVISATYGGKTGPATATVVAPELVSIAVTPVEPSVPKGRTQQFIATGTFSDTSKQVITGTVTWTVPASTPAGVATFGATAGLATARLVGFCTVQATDAASGIFGTTTLFVTPAVLDSIAVTSVGGTNVPVGITLQMTATGTYSDATTAVITNAVNWNSAGPAVASVNATGLVTGLSVTPSVSIIAQSNGKTGAININVTAAILSSIAVGPVGAVIPKGTSQPFTAIATYSDLSQADVTTSVTWTSSNGAIASVIATTGVVTGASKGTANIIATHSSGPSNLTAVTITDANLLSITVTPNPATVAAGKTQPFTAMGNYSDLSTANITNVVTWSSSNTAVARVSPGGLATSYTIGSATITATLGVPGTATLNVGGPVLDSISVTPVNPDLVFVSGNPPQLQFIATGVYSDGATVKLTTGVTWTSGTLGVAGIGAGTGLALTAGAAGTTLITATHIGTGTIGTTTLKVAADTVAPQVALTSPENGMVTSDKNLTVAGQVDDVNAIVTLFVNGTAVGGPLTVDGAGKFSRGVVLNNGFNSIVVRAVDVAGNTGTSGTVTVKVDPNKPAITLTSPVSGLLTNNATITVSGVATNANSVQVILNGVVKSVTVTANAFTTTVALTPGTNILSVTAYHKLHEGDPDYLGTSGVRTVSLDVTPPRVGIDTPVANSILSVPAAVVSGEIHEPGVTSVGVVLNGASPLTVPVVGGEFSQVVTLSNGANVIAVVATDQAGNASTTSIPVTYDPSKPAIRITAPANNLKTNAASQVFSGTVSDLSIRTATLLVNGVAEIIPVAPNGTFSKAKTLMDGTNSIEVRAQNNALPPAIGTSGSITVIIHTKPPVLTLGITDPTDSVLITVFSDEEMGAFPTVSVNGTAIVISKSGEETWAGIYPAAGNPPIPTGDYVVTATGIDAAGNRATATANFSKKTITVDGVVPTEVRTTDSVLKVQTNGAVTGASISVTRHLENPSGNVGAPQGAGLGAGAFIEINAAPELLNNLKQIYIEVNYDPAKLPPGTDETSLRLYLWDLTSGTWKIVPGSNVDTTRKVIYGTVTHLSKYGAFGAAAPAAGGPLPPPGPGTTSVVYKVTMTGQFIMDVVAKSDDSVASVTIPKDTIGKTAAGFPLQEVRMTAMPTPPAVPANQKAVSFVYDFGPDGTTFTPAVTVTFTYKDAQVPAGADEKKIIIAWRDSAGKWNNLASTVDATANTVTAKTDHFTPFALLIPTAPASFTTTKLTISPSEVKVNEQATVSITVTNTGDLSGSYDVVLKVASAAVETKSVTLAGGTSATVTFTVSKAASGSYDIAIGTESGKLKVKEEVPVVPPPPPPTPAAFTTSGLSISPASVQPGGSATVSVTVANTGEQQGTYTVTLKVNGATESSQNVTLAGGASQKVSFTITRSQPGTYSVTIDSLSGSLTVQQPATTPPTTPPVEPTEINWGPIIWGIVGGIVVIVLVVLLVMRLRKK